MEQHEHREFGEPIAGRKVLWGFLAGLTIGGAAGGWLGFSLGRGGWNSSLLAPLVASRPGACVFVCACFLGALLSLAGALWGTWSEPRAAGGKKSVHGGAHGMGHGGGFLQRLPVYGSIALALLMVWTLVVIAGRALGAGEPSRQDNRLTRNLKNSTRLGGAGDGETAERVLQAVYPRGLPAEVVRARNWAEALASTPLTARPVGAAVVLQSVGPDGGQDAAEVARRADARLASLRGPTEPNVIVVGLDADPRWSLPAGIYAARTGTPILFVNRSGVPPATDAALRSRGGAARIFVLGPEAAVPESVADRLRSYGRVTRISGGDFFANAVRFAEFRDEAAGFGWGRTGVRARRRSPFNAVLASVDRWQDGAAAALLGRTARAGPLLWTGRDRLPAAVDGYLWRQRPAFAATPAEGPFNHLWVIGSVQRVSYRTQAWADYSQEIEQYMSLGDSGVSGFEALAIGWLCFGLAGAVWIAVHSSRRLPEVMPTMRAAWALFALLLGPVAVWLYVLSYHRRPRSGHEGMTAWQRPLWLQAVSATVMMLAFDMMLMTLAVFLLARRGFPILRMAGPFYWTGTSMFLMMVWMYLAALLAMALVFHGPMTMHERKISSYWKAVAVGFPAMAATMTVESLGMMPTMWWAQMSFLPGMQMPTEDDFTMWATLLMAVAAGFLVALPFNAWMIRRGRRMGTM
jgi:MFS family permease